MNKLWGSLVVGIQVIVVCLYILPNDSTFWGTKVPAAGTFVILLCGIAITILSIRGLLRGEGKPETKEYSDEDAAKAKAELERLYLKEHGTLPDYPDEKKENDSGDGADKQKT